MEKLLGINQAVHPRVCGEHIDINILNFYSRGSSPRVRGTFLSPLPTGVTLRFIPACAGNMEISAICNRTQAVHPRVCGEH